MKKDITRVGYVAFGRANLFANTNRGLVMSFPSQILSFPTYGPIFITPNVDVVLVKPRFLFFFYSLSIGKDFFLFLCPIFMIFLAPAPPIVSISSKVSLHN